MSRKRSSSMRMFPGGATFCRQRLAHERQEAETWLNSRTISYQSFMESDANYDESTETTRLNNNNNNDEADHKHPNYWTFKRNFVKNSKRNVDSSTKKNPDSDSDDIFNVGGNESRVNHDDDDDDDDEDRMKFLRLKVVWRLVKSVTVAAVVVIFQLYNNWIGSNRLRTRIREDRNYAD